LQIEERDTETNYLLYALFPRPDDRVNYLADMFYYSEHFYSDKLVQLMGDMLYDAGLREYYKYEEELDLGEDGKYIPDFTIEDPESGIKYYWEHCGMLGDYGYSKRWEEKKKVYAKHGIVEGDNLIVTKDSLNGAINSAEIKKIVDRLKEELD